MRLTIHHATAYQYDAPVRLGPHTIRLRPREDATQRLLDYALEIAPAPLTRSEDLDAEGNAVVHCTFVGETQELSIRASMGVEMRRASSFDFVPDPRCASLPLVLDEFESNTLERFRRPAWPDAEVRAFADPIAAGSNGVVAFLTALAQRVKERFLHYVRHGGYAQPPAQTLQLNSGACRDIAVLFMECCRSQGIPARYASGYRRGDLTRRARDLHAWVEVYVPGGGWRGWDPSEGIAVTDTHVVVATAPDQYGTMPVEGSFSGPGFATMSYHIEIASP